MKTSKQILKAAVAAAIVCITAGSNVNAQNWTTTGNAGIAAGTNYLGTSDPNDMVFRSNAVERGRLLGTTGEWRFGTAANYASIDVNGRLKFSGNGVYQVAGNKYAFQFSGNPNLGLYFNSTLSQFEFRNAVGAAAFTVIPATGAGILTGSLKVGAYTLPATDGAVNQVLKTNGAGVLAWSNDNNNNNSWGLTGNAGTVSGTNFIGTTDNEALVTRTNNVERMRLLVDGKLGIGINSPNARLHVNSATGEDAFRVQIAGSTRFLVNQAGGASIGSSTEGPANGLYVSGNVGIGNTAPVNKLDVSGAIGTTSNVIFSGAGAGNTFADGQFLRDNSANALLEVELHGDFIPDTDGAHSLGTSVSEWSEVWAVDGTVNLVSAKTTKNVKNLSYGLNEIMKLRPISYNRINNPEGGDGVKRLGLIAEELKAVVPEAVKDYRYKEDQLSKKITKVAIAELGINMDNMIPILIKGMQEQQQIIEAQNKKIEEFTKLMTQFMQDKSASTSSTETNAVATKGVIINASLEQNAPNPFTSNTVIRYKVPATGTATIMIANTAGNTVKTFNLTSKGNGSVTVNANELAAGTYYYSLIVDGKKTDSKKMILVK